MGTLRLNSVYHAISRPIIIHPIQMFLYRFKVHYDTENKDGEIILLVPREPEDKLNKEKSEELTFCCCEWCHSKLCACLSNCLCNAFPQHSTVNQFFTPRMFEAYHEEGRRACEEAKAGEFLKTLCPANISGSSGKPTRRALQPPVAKADLRKMKLKALSEINTQRAEH